MSLDNLSKKRTIFIMIGVMLGVLLGALDSTIVGTAMPSIIKELNGMAHYSWPFTIYMLTSTVAIPIFGNIADLYGRKPVYLMGIFIFLVASVLCGTSATMMQLIIFRAVQGIGAGILMSNAFAIVGDIFAPKDRGKYMGFVSAMFGLSSIVGPALGGFITDSINWRWVFYINIPLGLVAIAVMFVSLPYTKSKHEHKKVDWLGIFLLILSVVPFLLALTWGGKEYPWGSPVIIGMFVFAIITLIIFVFVEKNAALPVIPLDLFKSRTFNISVIEGFITNAVMMSCIMLIPLFVQGVIGGTATSSGMVTTPMTLSLVAATIVSGNILSRTGRYKKMIFIALFSALIGILILTTVSINTKHWQILISMVMIGIGIGISIPVLNIIVQNVFPRNRMGVVTSALQFFRNIGGTVGSAIFGSILLNTLAENNKKIDLGAGAEMMKGIIANPQVLGNPTIMGKIREKVPEFVRPIFDEIIKQAKMGLADAVSHVFIFTAAIVIIAIIVWFFIKEEKIGMKKEEVKECVMKGEEWVCE